MGCLQAGFRRIGGDLNATAERVGNGLRCSFGLVCGPSISTPEGYEVLWVTDGMLLTVDGGRLYVRKQE